MTGCETTSPANIGGSGHEFFCVTSADALDHKLVTTVQACVHIIVASRGNVRRHCNVSLVANMYSHVCPGCVCECTWCFRCANGILHPRFRFSELFVALVVKALDAGDSVLDGSRPDAHLTFTLLDWVVLLASCACAKAHCNPTYIGGFN